MFFKELIIKEKNIITMVVSSVVSVTHISLYLYLYLKRQQLFSEYGTTDVMEIINKIPVFEPTPYELSIEYVFDMRFNLFIAAISLSIFVFSLVEFVKSRKKNK